MDKNLYRLMNWPEIESIVYSECDKPHDLLGGHVCDSGFLIQAFKPKAVCVWVKVIEKNKLYEMEKVDEAGFFALLLPGKKTQNYTLIIEDKNGKKTEIMDAYNFKSVIKEADLKAFNAGVNYSVYKMLGAHVMTIDGVSGVNFAAWAPNALRISVVGDFDLWDGRDYQMRRLGQSGVFEIFIPGIGVNDIYKYEIKCKGGLVMLKADPYGFYSEVKPNTASVVYDIENYQWNDKKWMDSNVSINLFERPMSIYEIHLGSFKKPDDKRKYYNYRELAPMLIAYVKDMGYTHVELMPVNEFSSDQSLGYHVTGFYAPTSRFGNPDDFKYLIDQLHQAGIGVIIDWVMSRFSKDSYGLSEFDGSCLYEYADSRLNSHPDKNTYLFNYGRPEVSNFLIGSALMLVEHYHVDGIKMDEFAPMLYRDYGKNAGEWIANIYGGKENLEAIELMKHLNSILKKRNHSIILIAEESTAWPRVTGKVEEESLGFDYKWNNGWMHDFIEFMKLDPIYRKGYYNELSFSMIYAYSENFLLGISHEEVMVGKKSMIDKMPGNSSKQKFANLRATYGYMFTHPGKKLLFMGQDFGQYDEWSPLNNVQWSLLEEDINNANMQLYVRDLNKLYVSEQALYEQDYTTDGFQWINNSAVEETILSFVRKASDGEELLIIANFTPVIRVKYQVGVNKRGKYKEIFNSDAVKYGGEGKVNARIKNSKEEPCDSKKDSITITVPPLGISVLRFIPFTQEDEVKLIKDTVVKPKQKSTKSGNNHKEIKKTGGEKSGSKTNVKKKIKILPN